ncbi:hypothetical protein GCM10009789_27860 [Kribbella sancticallisti]|uniref:Integral membrane protein n=1 Tax=Kribbella sancticallisti TaxID=460087 RepID=A0ABN2D8T4_9ACTN
MAADEVRKDLRAAVAARQELGPEYEAEIIESFLEKLDAARVARQPGEAAQPVQPVQQSRETDPGGLALAIVSVAAGIPITAIAANMEGTFAMIICWGGLVGINLARSFSRIVRN